MNRDVHLKIKERISFSLLIFTIKYVFGRFKDLTIIEPFWPCVRGFRPNVHGYELTTPLIRAVYLLRDTIRTVNIIERLQRPSVCNYVEATIASTQMLEMQQGAVFNSPPVLSGPNVITAQPQGKQT